MSATNRTGEGLCDGDVRLPSAYEPPTIVIFDQREVVSMSTTTSAVLPARLGPNKRDLVDLLLSLPEEHAS